MTSLGGHINHIYEDLDLRFRDLKIIIKGLGFGDFDVYEKFDGQSLFICWDFNKESLIVARNKQNIKDGGLDRYGISLKFGDRPEVESLFLGAFDVLSQALGKLEYNVKTQIFGSMGSVWFPVEILNPELLNTIQYNGKHIIFHNHYPVLFGFDGEPITRGLPRNMEILKKFIPLMNEGLDDWKIHGPKTFSLKNVDQFVIENACKKIDEIRKKAGGQDGMTIRTFVSERLRKDMERFPMVPEHVRAGLSKSIVKITGAPKTKDLLSSLELQTKKHAQTMLEEEKKVILPKILKPIENTVHKFSSTLLSMIGSDYIENPESESTRIRKEYDRCSDIIRNGGNIKHQNLLNDMHPKIGSGKVTMEGLVFEYSDKLFKVTGAFAPMNRVIAAIKYENKKRQINPNDVPLALFVKSS